MGFSFSPYVVIMLTAAAVCMIICVQVWFNRRGNSEAVPLVILMLASTEWLVTSALGFAGLDPSAKLLWAKIEYFGVTTRPSIGAGAVYIPRWFQTMAHGAKFADVADYTGRDHGAGMDE